MAVFVPPSEPRVTTLALYMRCNGTSLASSREILFATLILSERLDLIRGRLTTMHLLLSIDLLLLREDIQT